MKHVLFLIATSLCLNVFAQAPAAQPIVLKGHSNDVDGLSLSAQGFIATGGFDNKINIYKADSPYALFKTLGGHMGPVNVVSFNKNGKLMATGSEERLILLWDSLWRNTRKFEAHKDRINCLVFDNYGRYLFSGSDDKTMIVWDVTTGKIVKTITNTQAVTAIAPTSNFKFVYVAGAEPKIKLYDMMLGQVSKTLDGHTDVVNDIALSRSGKYLLSGSNDKTARLWNVATGKQIRIFPVDCWKVTSVAFSDDSRYAVTGCNDGSIKIWEVETGKLVTNYEFSGNIVRNVQFGKTNNEVLATFMLRNSEDYGLRIYKTPIAQTDINIKTPELVQDSTKKTTPAPLKPMAKPPVKKP